MKETETLLELMCQVQHCSDNTDMSGLSGVMQCRGKPPKNIVYITSRVRVGIGRYLKSKVNIL